MTPEHKSRLARRKQRPKIALMNHELSTTVDETIAALAANRDLNLYQASGRLVQLIHHDLAPEEPAEPCTEEPEPIDATGGTRRAAGALIISEVTQPLLVEMLDESARFYKFDARRKPAKPDPDNPEKKGDYAPTPPPPAIAAHIVSRGQWPLRVLRGTGEAPTLRLDGSVLQRPGYDHASGLYLDLNGVAFPKVPRTPTRDDALRALSKLVEPIKDFPFPSDIEGDWGGPSSARSVAFSLMLTGLVRRSIATAPAHAIDAPVMGTGKTKIAEIASVLVSGHAPTAISQGKTEEEFNKRLFSVLLTGDPVIIIDNIEQQISSDEFCTALTSETMKGRILGESRMAIVRTNALIVLNGNRMEFVGDITDRVVICNLDAEMEDPKTRKFDREPVAYALANRTELVMAGLTTMRAHAVAGFPGAKDLTPSRFPDWDKMVRAALVWLGEPDPWKTRDRLVAVDPVRDTHATLLRKWEDAIGVNVAVTADQVLKRSEVGSTHEADQFTWPPEAWWPLDAAAELRESLFVALEGRALNAKRLGRYLMKYDGRIYEGLSIKAKPDKKSASRFWLQRH